MFSFRLLDPARQIIGNVGLVSLSSLLLRFKQLQESCLSVRAKASRGLAFERLLSDLFRQQGILTTDPFAISGEQIDGAFEHKGWTYLVEAKWQDKKQSTNALYAFQGKPDRRIEGTRGLFISLSGYHASSITRFAEGRKPNTILWAGEHIEAVLEGKITIAELVDLSIRYAAERSELLVPLEEALNERTDRLFPIAIEASSAQVEAEIFATVGRKFIPKLYIERGIQEDLSRLIHPERELENLLAVMSKIGIDPPKELIKPAGLASDVLTTFRWIMERARSHQKTGQVPDRFRLFLDVMPTNPMGRMHVITSRAGMGKTNLLCHLAKSFATQQPTVFLTGRSGITSTTPLRELIESKIAVHLRDPFPRDRCFDHFVSLAQRNGTSLLVIIDALNEHKDFDLVNSSIAHFLNQVSALPVVILASCRDVYWPFFDTSCWPVGQWRLFDRRLDLFTTSESERAIRAYFDFYRITADLTSAAKEKLSHPLILRFFCEAYGDPNSATTIALQEVPDIRLKVLFDEYLARKLDSICHTAPKRFRTPRSVEEFLFRLADRMRTTRSRDVQRDAVSAVTEHDDLESPDSTYVSILGEDILLEEEPDEKSGVIRVVFTYDEFMEYMIARSMLRSTDPKNDIQVKQLFDECQNGSDTFPSFVGVIEYLAIILREDWQFPAWGHVSSDNTKFASAICRAIGKLGAKFVGRPEMSVLGELADSSFREVRVLSIQRLSTIASGKDYDLGCRATAIELLVDVLRHEDHIGLRVEAIKCFEDESISTVCDEGRRVWRWWEEQRTSVYELAIVFSDDHEPILTSLCLLFERRGWRNVFGAEDPVETIELVERVTPALIVTDMNKPNMSGAEMAKHLKSNSSTCSIPILLYSAYYDHDEYSDLFCAALSKVGYDIEDLFRTVEMILVGKYSN